MPAGEVLELIDGHVGIGVDVGQGPPVLLPVHILLIIVIRPVALVAVLDHPVAVAIHLDIVDGAALIVLRIVAVGAALALGHDDRDAPLQTGLVGVDLGQLGVLGAGVGLVEGGQDLARVGDVNGGVEVVRAVDACHAAFAQRDVKVGVGHGVAVDPQMRASHLGVAEEREGIQDAPVGLQIVVHVAGEVGAGVAQDRLEAPVAQIVDGRGPAGDVGAAPAGHLGVMGADGVDAPFAVRLGPHDVQLIVGHELPVGQVGVGGKIECDGLSGLGIHGVDRGIGVVGVLLAAVRADIVAVAALSGGRLVAVVGQAEAVGVLGNRRRTLSEGELVQLADDALFLGGEDEVHAVDAADFFVHVGAQLAPGGAVGARDLHARGGDGVGSDVDGADLRAARLGRRRVDVDVHNAVHIILALGNQNGQLEIRLIFAEVQILEADLSAVSDADDGAAVLGVVVSGVHHAPVIGRSARQRVLDVHGLVVGLGEDRRPQVAGNVRAPGVVGGDAFADGGGIFGRLDDQLALFHGHADLLDEALTARSGGGVAVVGDEPLAVDEHQAAVVVAPAGGGIIVLGDLVGARILAEEAAVVADDAAPVPAGEVLELVDAHVGVGVDVGQRPPALLAVHVLLIVLGSPVALVAVLDHPETVAVDGDLVDGAALIVLGVVAVGAAFALGHNDRDAPLQAGAVGVDLGELAVLGAVVGLVEGGQDVARVGDVDGGVEVVRAVDAHHAVALRQGRVEVGVGDAVAVGPQVGAAHLGVAEERERIQDAQVRLQIIVHVAGEVGAGVSQRGLKAPVAQIVHRRGPAGDVGAAPAGELGVVGADSIYAPLAVRLGPHDMQLIVRHEFVIRKIGVCGVAVVDGLPGLGIDLVHQGVGVVRIIASAYGTAVVTVAAGGVGGLIAVRSKAIGVDVCCGVRCQRHRRKQGHQHGQHQHQRNGFADFSGHYISSFFLCSA